MAKMTNSSRWAMFVDLKNMILANDGTIYGGFVRDMVLREHGSKLFYEKNTWPAPEIYDNARVMPKNGEMRLVLPNDIDCSFRSKSDAQRFIDMLTIKHFRFTEVLEDRGHTLPVHRLTVSHMMFAPSPVPSYIRDAMSESFAKHFTIDIDLVFPDDDDDDIELPFERYDFVCNAMYINRFSPEPRATSMLIDGTGVSEEAVLACILQDIVSRHARMNTVKPAVSRIADMLRGGWSITESTNNKVVVAPKDVDVAHPSTIYRRLNARITDRVDNVCLICLDKFGVGQTCLRNKCCSARYHEWCYVETFDRVARCPQCRCTL